MSRTILKGLHRRAIGIGNDDEILAPKGIATGGDGTPSVFLPSHDYVTLFDDFQDTGAGGWVFVKGDTGTVTAGAVLTGANGNYRLQNESAPLPAPTENLAITQGLLKNWKANMGGPKNGRLRMAARIKFPSVARADHRQHVFVGFSDSGGAEMPAYDTGAGVISNAADLVGFIFSPGGDTGWSMVSAKSTAGDSGDQLAVAGVGPSANQYTTLELEVRSGISDTGATAHFWVDGVKKGAISSPVNSATALTPWIGFFDQDTGGEYLDIDYVHIAAPRDTGL